jgi:hypothetical protein
MLLAGCGGGGNDDNKQKSSPSIVWQKSLGGSSTDWAASVQQTNDNGYIIAGSNRSNDGDVTENQGGADYRIVKLKQRRVRRRNNADSPFPSLPRSARAGRSARRAGLRESIPIRLGETRKSISFSRLRRIWIPAFLRHCGRRLPYRFVAGMAKRARRGLKRELKPRARVKPMPRFNEGGSFLKTLRRVSARRWLLNARFLLKTALKVILIGQNLASAIIRQAVAVCCSSLRNLTYFGMVGI